MIWPSRRHMLIGSGVVAAVALAGSGGYLAGKRARPKEVKTEQRSEQQATILYASHGTADVKDKGTERTRVVKVERVEPTGAALTTTTTDTLKSADLSLHLDWTGTESRRESASAAATTVSRSTSADWRLGVAALWTVDSPGLAPDAYALEIDRRVLGPFSLGVRGQITPDNLARSSAGIAASVEW